jgi:hypothetical protein
VCNLARVDLDLSAPVHLLSSKGVVTARYVGQFSGAIRRWTLDPMTDKDGEFDIVVRAQHLRDVAALLDDDEEVTLASIEASQGLTLRMKSTRMKLAFMQREVQELRLPRKALAEVNMDALLAEYVVAAKFVAQSLQRPVFTYVRLTFRKSRIDIETCDGFSLLYRVSVPCSNGPAQATEIIVPTFDFQLGLEICAGGIGRVGWEGANLIALSGPNGEKFNCALYAGGGWPTNRQTLQDPDAAQLRIPRATVKRVISAANVLGGFRNLHVEPAAKGTRLSFDGEGGGFAAMVRGSILKADIFDIGSLGLLAEMGEDLRFYLGVDVPLRVERPETEEPRRLKRTAWLMGKVQA